MNTADIPDFSSQSERTQWIIDHADKFTLVRRSKGHNYRVDVASLDVAIQQARGVVKAYPQARILIYAIYGPIDTWVANVDIKGVYDYTESLKKRTKVRPRDRHLDLARKGKSKTKG